MGNKLRDMFNKETNGYSFSLNFDSIDDKKKFIKALSNVTELGKPQKVSFSTSMIKKRNNSSYVYPYETINNIEEIWLYPDTEEVFFPITYNGEKINMPFYRVNAQKVIKLDSKNSTIVKFQLYIYPYDNNKVTFNYTLHPEKAISLEELISEYEKNFILFLNLFKRETKQEQIENVMSYFRTNIAFFKRVKEINSALNIEIEPKKIIDEKNAEFFIEKIYILLVKKEIIRENRKINYVTSADVVNVETGTELFASFLKKIKVEIFGKQFDFYCIICMFNAVVNDIQKDVNGDDIIYFKDSIEKPMYCSYKIFMEEEDAIIELDNILEKKESYENAENISIQIKKLLQSE